MCDLYNQKQQHSCFCCVENSLLNELFLEVTQRGIRNFTLVRSFLVLFPLLLIYTAKCNEKVKEVNLTGRPLS